MSPSHREEEAWVHYTGHELCLGPTQRSGEGTSARGVGQTQDGQGSGGKGGLASHGRVGQVLQASV